MRIRSCFLLALSFAWGHGLSADVLYSATDLGFPSYGNGINNAGQVTGHAYSDTGRYAFLYSNGQVIDLGGRGNGISGNGINNAGQVTGISGDGHAVIWTNGQMMDLGPRTGNGINDAGQVTGTSGGHAVIWTNGQMIDLGPGSGNGINNAGQVTGYLTDIGRHAFLYSNGQMTDLGTLAGRFSYGLGINDAGQVTGYSDTANGYAHAFLYSSGQMIDLGTLGPCPRFASGFCSVGLGINNAGQVVGVSYRETFNLHTYAFLYSDGQMKELDNLTDRAFDNLRGATAINDGGQIVANSGRHRLSGHSRA